MNGKRRLPVYWAACAVCILFGLGSAFAAIDIPAKLKDVPLFQGAKVEHAMDMENHAMVTAKVKAKPEAVAEFYKGAMQGKGWKIFMQAEQDNVKLIHFRKDNQMLQVSIQTEEGEEETTFNLVMTSQ